MKLSSNFFDADRQNRGRIVVDDERSPAMVYIETEGKHGDTVVLTTVGVPRAEFVAIIRQMGGLF